MSDFTKETLSYSGLVVLAPLAVVSYLGTTFYAYLMFFSHMKLLEGLLLAAAFTGVLNGAGFFAGMMAARSVANFLQKFKGER